VPVSLVMLQGRDLQLVTVVTSATALRRLPDLIGKMGGSHQLTMRRDDGTMAALRPPLIHASLTCVACKSTASQWPQEFSKSVPTAYCRPSRVTSLSLSSAGCP
jgi:hypothetical protein